MGTNDRNGGNLVYVGPGQGEFAVEPQMKYVGYGGDYAVRRTPNMCCLIAGPALLYWICWSPEPCLDHRENYLYHWSPDKIQQCCARGFVDCPTVEAPQGPVDPFNCMDDAENWQAEWSTAKKVFCCRLHGKGCGQDAEQDAAAYHCDAAFPNWVKGWSEKKKAWCCARGVKCCKQDEAAAGEGYGGGTKHGANFHGAPVAAITGITPAWQLRSR